MLDLQHSPHGMSGRASAVAFTCVFDSTKAEIKPELSRLADTDPFMEHLK